MGVTLQELQQRFGDDITDGRAWLHNADGCECAEVPRAKLRDVVMWLRDAASPRYRQVAALTATD